MGTASSNVLMVHATTAKVDRSPVLTGFKGTLDSGTRTFEISWHDHAQKWMHEQAWLVSDSSLTYFIFTHFFVELFVPRLSAQFSCCMLVIMLVISV